ncbi:dipeptide/oligopeptide/nickel ABC transporter ATP-binding protein [Microbacterium sorbitolivorans]|uniref:ATP-binding cassette domain-containing protein n=1 Tax=Microbacterium sorbitolivorans TaxID=1867410 RepID=A0A367Y6D3_9MICO|nr:dipeptide/oligopeptide/nickel ABC transporter permease/ATP-binding protein [Microbacterium sorbitolivorans]RCK61199.1 ATP-binding cassette domain-containing protein [Microbacterium sorbitolivorans]GGF34183.1 dipeptide/oligopeptide/nickel ABC transporter ATP-binding protein [Microbacterium sorbitolivorans]
MSSEFTAVLPTGKPARKRGSVVVRALRNPAGLVAGIVIAIVFIVAILADVIAPYGAQESDLSRLFEHGGGGHLLGTDGAGRDVLSLLIYGARSSLIGAAIAVGVSMLVGIPTGLIAGFYGRWFDTVGTWISSAILALPGIVVLLAFRASVSTSMWAAMLVFGVLLAPSFFTLVRAAVRSVRNELYVDAARVTGVSDARIISRHVLTIVRAPIVIQAAMVAALGLMIQAGLEFLGMGDRETASWGQSLNEGFQNIYRADHLILWPGLALGVTIAAFALFANALRDALDAADAPRTPPAPPAANSVDPSVVPTAAGELLSIRDLRVAYGSGDDASEVVHGIDIDLDAGKVVGLVGESGSGKTQTALAVLGLLPDGGHITGGTISIDGRETTLAQRVAMLGSDIGYIPQEPMSNLDPAFTIGSQLIEPLRRHLKIGRREAEARAIALLDRVGIPDPKRLMRSYPHQISGGMAQRVLIAGAVACEPRLLIADEPTTALDVTIQAEILDLLRDLQQERGMGLLIVTHNFGVVADICDEVYVMQMGVLVEHQSAGNLFADPRHDYTRALLGASLEGGPSRRQREKEGQR